MAETNPLRLHPSPSVAEFQAPPEFSGSVPTGSPLDILDWGLLEYGESFERQITRAKQRMSGEVDDALVIVEHPPSVTLGRSAGAQDLLIPEAFFKQNGVALHRVDRGGQATVHEPGQLVGYPIVEIRDRDLHRYVDNLLGALVTVLGTYGLEARRKEGEPGLWIDGKKIASIGIAVKKWVTSHGIGLNVNNDLSTFDLIVPCGKPGEQVTSMARELDRELDMGEVKRQFVAAFIEGFGYSPEDVKHA